MPHLTLGSDASNGTPPPSHNQVPIFFPSFQLLSPSLAPYLVLGFPQTKGCIVFSSFSLGSDRLPDNDGHLPESEQLASSDTSPWAAPPAKTPPVTSCWLALMLALLQPATTFCRTTHSMQGVRSTPAGRVSLLGPITRA